MFGVRGLGLGAALTFGAVLWWANRGTESVADGSARLREAPASHADTFPTNAWVATAVRDDPAVTLLPESEADQAFDDYVEGKYRFLLAGLSRAPDGSESLRALLHQRERLVVDINTARQSADTEARASLPDREASLATLDQHIAAQLPAGDIAAFQALKDSHIEQFQVDDYANGISQVSPLADDQRRAILFSKLASRQQFRAVLEQSGLMRGDLPPRQREAALGDVTRALRESRDRFLQEARQQLPDDEQFGLLANYENGEYSAELEKLRRIAAGG